MWCCNVKLTKIIKTVCGIEKSETVIIMITYRGRLRCGDTRCVINVFRWVIVRVCRCPNAWIILALIISNHVDIIITLQSWADQRDFCLLGGLVWELAAVNSRHVTKVINSPVLAYCINSFHKGTFLRYINITYTWRHGYISCYLPPVASAQRFEPVGGQCWATPLFGLFFNSGEVKDFIFVALSRPHPNPCTTSTNRCSGYW
jgi:hypothetical protein